MSRVGKFPTPESRETRKPKRDRIEEGMVGKVTLLRTSMHNSLLSLDSLVPVLAKLAYGPRFTLTMLGTESARMKCQSKGRGFSGD